MRAIALLLLLGFARADLPPTYLAQLDNPVAVQPEDPAVVATADREARKRGAVLLGFGAVAAGGAIAILGWNRDKKEAGWGATTTSPNTLMVGTGAALAIAGVLAASMLWPRD